MKVNKSTGNKRLLKLADHLINGKLHQDKWDFSVIHEKVDCGTIGCALGELPGLFPKHWKFLKDEDSDYYPALNGFGTYPTFNGAATFFGINPDEAVLLFAATDSENLYRVKQVKAFGGRPLVEGSKRATVGKNIIAFVQNREASK